MHVIFRPSTPYLSFYACIYISTFILVASHITLAASRSSPLIYALLTTHVFDTLVPLTMRIPRGFDVCISLRQLHDFDDLHHGPQVYGLHSLLRPLRNLGFTVSSSAIVFFACRSSSYVYGRHRRLAISLVHLAFDIGRNHSLLASLVFVSHRFPAAALGLTESHSLPLRLSASPSCGTTIAAPNLLHRALLRNASQQLLNEFPMVKMHLLDGCGVPPGVRCLSEMRRNLSISSFELCLGH
jgi:hypothetical protein